MSDSTIRSVITPNDKFIRDVFSWSKSYYIDIYQREYRWQKVNVETLLNDIEVRFNQYSLSKTELKEIEADVKEHFEPYYLNTFLTHSFSTAIFIVDGQQRLTTILLMLIKIYKILCEIEKYPEFKEKTLARTPFDMLILERDDSGKAKRFKIFNPNRQVILEAILDGKETKTADETQKRILENYTIIDAYFESFFRSKDEKQPYDVVKLTYYIYYLLDRISIVEIKIEQQKNVAMIFEVVNDRGLGLKPYEILKGKLIGNLRPSQKEKASEVWTDLQNRYFATELKNSTESQITLDMFFQTFFRAKFANSENDYEKFESDYHYEMYRNPKIREYFGDFNNVDLLFERITKEIKYFADLYLWLRTSYENEYLIFNKLLDQNQQYLLIMSGLKLNDPDRESKITGISRKFDQFHAIIRLLDVYDSSLFQRLIYPINREIREENLNRIYQVFEAELIQALEEGEVIQKDEMKSISELFTYERFRGVRNRWTNFSKYILMRIDRYLAQMLDKPSYASGDLRDLEDHFNKTTRRVHGMHLEHIYAFNDSNKAQFTTSNGVFDDQTFNTIRNYLGVVLLLKDRQNESSNNETYREKINRYKTSNFIWNELMVGHLDGVDLRNIPNDWTVESIDPDANNSFPREKVEARQKSIYAAIKRIWLDEVNGK